MHEQPVRRKAGSVRQRFPSQRRTDRTRRGFGLFRAASPPTDDQIARSAEALRRDPCVTAFEQYAPWNRPALPRSRIMFRKHPASSMLSSLRRLWRWDEHPARPRLRHRPRTWNSRARVGRHRHRDPQPGRRSAAPTPAPARGAAGRLACSGRAMSARSVRSGVSARRPSRCSMLRATRTSPAKPAGHGWPTPTLRWKPGGIRLFDYWYGGAVLAQGAETRVKVVEQPPLRGDADCAVRSQPVRRERPGQRTNTRSVL